MTIHVELLILIVAANGAPIILDKLLGPRLAWPLDGGLVLADGRRLLGRSVTVRGVVAAVGLTAAVAPALGHGVATGAMIGLLAMAGDAFSSWVKRRLGLAASDQALGLDQVPESLLPLLPLARADGLGAADLLAIVAAFTVFDLLVSRLLYRVGWRDRPY